MTRPKFQSLDESYRIVTEAARSSFGSARPYFEIERRAAMGEFQLPREMTVDHVKSIFRAALGVEASPVVVLNFALRICRSSKVTVEELDFRFAENSDDRNEEKSKA